ncbi:MAG: ABC transporter ATP-binding protein [archaeon]
MRAIEINGLSKTYGDVEAVRGISLAIEKGDFFGFIGPNGAGKTTTINSIMGLVSFKGSIKVMGKDVVADYQDARRLVGLSPQEFNFDRFLTVEECLLYTAGYFGIPKAEALRRSEKLLKRFSIADKRKKRVESLSGGMKRRLIIARALIQDPEILILDEPTAGIDVQLRREFWDILQDINKEGKTILLTSHYIEEVEKLCSTIGIINNGRIIELAKKDRIMAHLSNECLIIRTKTKPKKLVLKDADLIIRTDGNTIKVIGKNVRKRAARILSQVEKIGIDVEEIEMSRESLENVFLRITESDKGE